MLVPRGHKWDITYLNGPIKGKYFYLYLFLDLFSRRIIGWEVRDSETAEQEYPDRWIV